MKDTAKAPEPMDDSVREAPMGTPVTNHQRVCGAIKQLVREFHALFPETPVEYSNFDGRNTALDVTFDLTVLDAETDRVDALNLLHLLGDDAYNNDPRVEYVLVSQEDSAVLVSMRSNARTQDSPEPFGLAEALSVLAGEDEGYDDDGDDSLSGDDGLGFLSAFVGGDPWKGGSQ